MSDHEWRQVRVTFRKAVSDGNYGTESAEVMLEDWMTDSAEITDTYIDVAKTMLKLARAVVHAELERSPSPRVREAIDRIRTYTGVAGQDDDGEE
jgi:hypothetical protein